METLGNNFLDLFGDPESQWQYVVEPGVSPNRYQLAIFQAISGRNTSALVIPATPGAGKTWVIRHIAKLFLLNALSDERIIVAAFNVHAKNNFAADLNSYKNVRLTTVHGIGYQVLKRAYGQRVGRADEYKYQRIVCRHVEIWLRKHSEYAVILDNRDVFRELTQEVVKAIDLGRSSLCDFDDPAAIAQLVNEYGIGLDPALYHLLPRIIDQGKKDLAEQGSHDFGDMIYMPVALNLDIPTAAMVLIDEAQDLSTAQITLMLKCVAPGGQMVAVGDPDQSINAFSGAAPTAIEDLCRLTDATVMKLPVSYRCAKQIVALAKQYVPYIEARPDAPNGEIVFIDYAQMAGQLKTGDMVLTRTTAAAVSTALYLNTQGLNARVRGLNLVDELITQVDRIIKLPDFEWETFETFLDRHVEEQTAWYAAHRYGPSSLIALIDKTTAIRHVWKGIGKHLSSVKVFKDNLRDLFTEDDSDAIRLSTIHSAKGDEAENVWIVNPHEIPLVWDGQQGWEWQQEMNALYVAITRARQRLYIVRPPNIDESKYAYKFAL